MPALYDMRDVADIGQPAAPFIDKEQLEYRIEYAESLVQSAFTAATWANMQEALQAARLVFADIDATQIQVNTAANDLAHAIAALQRVQTPGTPHQPTAMISVIDPQGATFFVRQSLVMGANETAYSLLRRTGLDIESRGGYVAAINGWGEFSDGEGSGWMFRVNGVFHGLSSSLISLNDGDVVEWLFTRDFGLDIGGNVGNNRPQTPGGGVQDAPANVEDDDEEDEEAEEDEENNDQAPSVPLAAAEFQTNAPPASHIFDDISVNSWYHDAVSIVVARGLFDGVSTYQFAPNANMTRGMFAAVLARFADADQDNFDALEWAAQHGIMLGDGNGNFNADAAITREQMATMLWRLIALLEIELPANDVAAFADQDAIADWAIHAVGAIQSAKIITGRPDGTFDPQATATRAEVATIFARLLEIQ